MAEIIFQLCGGKRPPLGVTSDSSMTLWLCNVALGLQPTHESLFLSPFLGETRFSTFMIPLPLRSKSKALWSTSSLDRSHRRSQQAIQQACPGAPLCLEWTGAPGDLVLWQRWHHSLKRNVTERLWLCAWMPGLSVCLLQVGYCGSRASGFLELPSIVFSHTQRSLPT